MRGEITMKKIKNILLILLLTSVFSCSSSITQPDWKFIQSIGGISADKLEMIDGIYYLPVKLNLASYKPGTKSAMVCTATSARIAGKQIMLRVKTDSMKNVPTASVDCPKAKIGGIPDGEYRVVYVGPDGESHKVNDVVANLAGD